MTKRRYEIDALRLQREIKAGEIRPVYLFYGEEDFYCRKPLPRWLLPYWPEEQRTAAAVVWQVQNTHWKKFWTWRKQCLF